MLPSKKLSGSPLERPHRTMLPFSTIGPPPSDPGPDTSPMSCPSMNSLRSDIHLLQSLHSWSNAPAFFRLHI
jgi:hypothetical protein